MTYLLYKNWDYRIKKPAIYSDKVYILSVQVLRQRQILLYIVFFVYICEKIISIKKNIYVFLYIYFY